VIKYRFLDTCPQGTFDLGPAPTDNPGPTSSPPPDRAAVAASRFLLIVERPRSNDPRGLFSEAVWIIFEKLGLLDYELIDWPTFRAIDPDHAPHVAIVTAPVVRGLALEDVEWLAARGAPSLIEGPWPAALDAWFGLELERDAEPRTAARVIIDDEAIAGAVSGALTGIKGPSNTGGFTGPDSIWIRERTRVARRQSDVRSRFDGVNARAREASWSLSATALETPPGTETILRWADARDPRGILMFRRGDVIVTTAEILSYLAQDYTAAAMHHEYAFSNDRHPLELILIAELLRALEAHAVSSSVAPAAARVRMAPWPRGKQYALQIRHDVDRLPSDPDFQRLLDAERRAGVGVTCCFLPKTADARTAERFEANGAEIAWHAAHLEPDGDDELRTVQTLTRRPIAGVSIHGNEGFYGWRGGAHWEIVGAMGLAYCEHLSAMRYLPSRVFKLDESAAVAPYPFVCLPHHQSLLPGGDGPQRDARDHPQSSRHPRGPTRGVAVGSRSGRLRGHDRGRRLRLVGRLARAGALPLRGALHRRGRDRDRRERGAAAAGAYVRDHR